MTWKKDNLIRHCGKKTIRKKKELKGEEKRFSRGEEWKKKIKYSKSLFFSQILFLEIIEQYKKEVTKSETVGESISVNSTASICVMCF